MQEENLNLVEGANIELIRTGDEVSINNTYQYDDTALEEEIQQIEASLETYSLITETGSKVQIELNNTNYKMKVKLLDKNDNVINTSNEVDLPIEQLVKSITYDSETKEIVFTLQDGTQTRVPLSDLISGLVTEDDFNESQEEQNETIEALKEKVEVYKTIFNALPHIEDEDTEMTLDDTANSVMEMTLKGNTSQTGTPTPDTPIPINVVSGDNTITVCGKNLANSSEETFTFSANTNTTKTLGSLNLVAGTTYYYSYTIENATTSSTRNTPWLQIQNGTREYQTGETNYNTTTGRKVWTYNCQTTGTYDFGYWCHTPNVNLTVSDFMISTSSDTTYEPYQSQTYHITLPNGMEFCGIGDYQDYFTKNSGKNLLNKDGGFTLNGIGSTGVISPSNQNALFDDYIPVKPNTTYTLSLATAISYPTIAEYNGTTFVKRDTGSSTSKLTFTTDNNTNAVRVVLNKDGSSTMTQEIIDSLLPMLELGSDRTIYEPYGTGLWCKYNAIGKVVLDGSETTWSIDGLQSGLSYRSFYTSQLQNIILKECNVLCDRLEKNTNVYSQDVNGIYCNYAGMIRLKILNSSLTSVSSLQTYLSSNNLTLYYVLNTPYLSLIEDNNLIEQLDNIEKAMSYLGQTNINQTNNDKPFIISAVALKDLTNLGGE